MESLYTKYRPQTFDDVVGQTHVVSTLENAIRERRINHAYLFCGPRGTGKTTMARLLAKALECERGEGQLPDGSCEQCRLIATGEHPDVLELDAASRTGVDNVREEIIGRVGYAAVMGRCKVYIIDEVHMLTTAAFNALLKTLEEPPSHVYFVMCTTDPQKIPTTILSRVQRFNFHPIAAADLKARLEHVCQGEGFTWDNEALDLIVRHARGGMRDALSTLEQLSTFGGGAVTADVARDLLGEVSNDALSEVSQAIAGRDVPTLFSQVAQLSDDGRDLMQFCRELAAHLRDVYVVAAVGAQAGVVEASAEELDKLAGEAEAFGSPDRVSRALEICSDALKEMRLATNQRLVLEVALTRMARPGSDLTLEALADRLSALERQVAQLSAGAPVRAAEKAASPVRANIPQAQAPRPAPAATQAAEPAQARVTAPVARQAAASARPQQTPASDRPSGGRNGQTGGQTGPAGRGSAVPARSTAWDGGAPGTPAPSAQAQQSAPATTQRSTQQVAPAAPPAGAASGSVATPGAARDAGALQRRFKQVVDKLVATSPSRGSLLLSASALSDDGRVLTVALPEGSGFALHMLERKDVETVVASAVTSVFGARRLVYVEQDVAQGEPNAPAGNNATAQPQASVAPAPQPPVLAAPPARPVQGVPRAQPKSRAAEPEPAQPAPARQVNRTPQPKPAPQPPRPAPQASSTPQASSAPQVLRPAPSSSVAKPAVADFPMPWDDVPEYEEVPYDDASAILYGEDEVEEQDATPPASQKAGNAAPPEQAGSVTPAKTATAAPPAKAKAAPREQAGNTTSREAQAKSQQSNRTASKPAPPASSQTPAPQQTSPHEADAAHAAPSEAEASRIMAMLRGVFGEGVTMSVEAPGQSRGAAGSTHADDQDASQAAD